MEINPQPVKITNSLPTIEKAKELTKNIERLVGVNNIVIMSIRLPTVKVGKGNLITMNDAEIQKNVSEVFKAGILVVHSPFDNMSEEEKKQHPHAVYSGEKVVINKNTQALTEAYVNDDVLFDGLTPELVEAHQATSGYGFKAVNYHKSYKIEVISVYDVLFVRKTD